MKKLSKIESEIFKDLTLQLAVQIRCVHLSTKDEGQHNHHRQYRERHIVIFPRRKRASKYDAQGRAKCLECGNNTHVEIVVTSLP